MGKCPICNTEYIPEEQIIFCSTCGWDLAPYPVTFPGQLPDAFIEKEQAKLAWAKQMWARSQSHLKEISQFQSERQEINQKLSQLQSEINLFEQEVFKKQSRLEEKEQEKAKFESDLLVTQCQLKESEKERSHLQSKIEKISQDQSLLQNQIAKILTELKQLTQQDSSNVVIILYHLKKQLERMENQINLARKSLAHLIPHLTLQLAEELTHIPDQSWATAEIDKMLQSSPKKRHKTKSYRREILRTIKLILEASIEDKIHTIGEYFDKVNDKDYIAQADAILSVRHELKIKGIIQRDIQGDTLYD